MTYQKEIVSAPKVRESNIELLRLVSMLLVMVVHANFWSLGAPSKEVLHVEFASSSSRVLVEALSIICVNVFVLISGWFGIKASVRKLSGFLFQILYFNVVMYLIWVVLMGNWLSVTDTFKYFLLLTERYWFIKVYIALFIISPCLNVFVESASKRGLQLFLLAIFVFQSLYGWIWPSVTWISKGYSLFTMAFLYMLARYMRIYPPHSLKWLFRGKFHFVLYLIYTLLITGLYLFLAYRNSNGGWLFAYSCPLVIFSSIHFFYVFLNIHIISKFVNYIAVSTFAVYLFHGNPLTADAFYRTKISSWFIEDPMWLFLGKTVSYIFLLFFGAIIIDQPRRWIWSKMEHLIVDYSKGI